MRRLGIYVFHDRQGIIDAHILYFMDRFTEIVQELVIVCTDNLPDYERKKFVQKTSTKQIKRAIQKTKLTKDKKLRYKR